MFPYCEKRVKYWNTDNIVIRRTRFPSIVKFFTRICQSIHGSVYIKNIYSLKNSFFQINFNDRRLGNWTSILREVLGEKYQMFNWDVFQINNKIDLN